jgi:hypothetical protein
MTIRVAASSAAGSKAGSTPRSKRWRASVVEQGAFDEHAAGGVVTAGRLTPHHAGEGLHAGGIRDDAIGGVGDIGPPVQGGKGFAGAGAQGQCATINFIDIKDMQRAAKIEGEEIGDVDECIDRPQADAGEAFGEPAGGGAIAQAADGSAQDPGAGGRHLIAPDHRAGEFAAHGFDGPRQQGPKTGGGEIAGDAAD